jgi:hypothetical protein
VSLEWLSAERLVAAAALGQLAVLILAARYARNQVAEARRLREAGQALQEAEARPYVVVDFELGDRPPFINLVVANLGKTAARNVRIEVDPPFESSLDAKVPVPVSKLKLFTEGITSMVPGKRIVFLFDVLNQRPKELPTAYRVTLRYDGERGPLPADEQHLNLEVYYNLLSVDRYTTHDVSKTLTKLLRRFEQWSAGPEGGLLVLSPDDKRRRDGEFLAWVEEQQAADLTSTDGQTSRKRRFLLGSRLLDVVGRLRRHL